MTKLMKTKGNRYEFRQLVGSGHVTWGYGYPTKEQRAINAITGVIENAREEPVGFYARAGPRNWSATECLVFVDNPKDVGAQQPVLRMKSYTAALNADEIRLVKRNTVLPFHTTRAGEVINWRKDKTPFYLFREQPFAGQGLLRRGWQPEPARVSDGKSIGPQEIAFMTAAMAFFLIPPWAVSQYQLGIPIRLRRSA